MSEEDDRSSFGRQLLYLAASLLIVITLFYLWRAWRREHRGRDYEEQVLRPDGGGESSSPGVKRNAK
jgi:hypothetical protein